MLAFTMYFGLPRLVWLHLVYVTVALSKSLWLGPYIFAISSHALIALRFALRFLNFAIAPADDPSAPMWIVLQSGPLYAAAFPAIMPVVNKVASAAVMIVAFFMVVTLVNLV